MITIELTKNEIDILKRGLVEYEIRLEGILEGYTNPQSHIDRKLKKIEDLYFKIGQAK